MIDRVAERILLHKPFAVALVVRPILVIRGAEKDADLSIDVDETGRDELAVHDDAGRDVHGPAPFIHRFVVVIADVRILERTPAAE